MVEEFKDFLAKGDNLKLFIIIASFIVLLLISIIVMVIFSAKKKKYRKSLEILRSRTQKLKQHEVIKNYSSYDNLKSDQKLGMLVLRWKKEIEKLVREVDAQYSMLDVLEDAINQNNYQYFVSLKNSFYNDLEELEGKADKLKDEIIEYIDMASDNRKYINKYYDMVQDLKQKYQDNKAVYNDNTENVEQYFKQIDEKFVSCRQCIEASEFVEADNIASNIFKEIKILENYLVNAPTIIENINEIILPKSDKIKQLANNFTDDDLEIMNIHYSDEYNTKQEEIKTIIEEVNAFKIDDFESRLSEIEAYFDTLSKQLNDEVETKTYIEKQLKLQNEDINKVENTANNFISIFKIVEGSYDITEEDIEHIENMLKQIAEIKTYLIELDNKFTQHELAYRKIKEKLENNLQEITGLSKDLDRHLNIIDEIYKDEKNAHEQIILMTEKINGTKKYIKYANLENKGKYLEIVRNLNLELSVLYKLLNTFPIDIVKLNEALQLLTNKVEKTTQDINSIIYKTLLTEFVLVYANRYFADEEHQKELLIAENLFYKHGYTRAYERVMKVLEAIDEKQKQIVLEKYQAKFSEIFK